MNEAQARSIFGRYLAKECPECKAPVNEMCVSDSLWIHLERMKLDPNFVA